MNKKEIIAFFNRQASEWDAHMIKSDRKINYILDAAGVYENGVVLDVACGTGVLFPYYLERNVAKIVGVDFSSEMVRIAVSKCCDPRVEVICGDIETIPVRIQCDCCVVYNAFPHFEEPVRLLGQLSKWIKPNGRLTIAHGMSLEALARHHEKRAQHVSRDMLTPQEMKKIASPWFDIDIEISDDEKYVVSGVRRNFDGE